MLRLYNARIMPMLSPGDCSILNGELWTDGERISYVGCARQDAPHFERELDLGGDLVIPGFKNAHTHNPMVFLRSFADGLPLHDWLFQQVFPREARLHPDAIYALTRLAILELLSGGVTAAFDMYFHRDAYVRAVIDSGFRSVLCGALSAGDDWSVARRDFEKYNSMGPLVGYRLGFHAEYTASEELLRYISGLAHDYKAEVWAHNSETKTEYDGCIERHGMSPTRYFDSLGLFDYGGGGFHCVWFDEGDMQVFKERGLWAVSCPASNAKLASGVAPLCEFLDRGINLALGTDGASSNNALDMFREMYLACVLQKLRRGDAAACPAGDLLQRRRARDGPARLRQPRPRQGGRPRGHRPQAPKHAAPAGPGAESGLQRLEGLCAPDHGRRAHTLRERRVPRGRQRGAHHRRSRKIH